MSNYKIANREVMKGFFSDFTTKKPFAYIDYANVVGEDVTGELVWAYGGDGHPKRIGFSGEKGGTVKIETQMQPFELYSLITGATIGTTSNLVMRERILSAGSGTFTLTLTKTPLLTGANINVFADTDDCGTALVVTNVTTTVTLPASETSAKYYWVYYYYAKTGTGIRTLNIKSDTFPKTFSYQGQTIYKDDNGYIVDMYVFYYKLMPQPNISLSWSNTGDPVNLVITCDIMADENGNMIDMVEAVRQA